MTVSPFLQVFGFSPAGLASQITCQLLFSSARFAEQQVNVAQQFVRQRAARINRQRILRFTHRAFGIFLPQF